MLEQGVGKSFQRRTLEACALVRGHVCQGGEAVAEWVSPAPRIPCTLPGAGRMCPARPGQAPAPLPEQQSLLSAALLLENTPSCPILSSVVKKWEFPWCRGAPCATDGVQLLLQRGLMAGEAPRGLCAGAQLF